MHFKGFILTVGMLAIAAPAQTRPVIAAPAPTPASASAPAPAQAAAVGGVAASPSALPPGASSDTYIIGAGVVLQLNVWKEPNFSVANIPVRPDGKISLSLLGDVPASGITPMALGRDITERLKKYLNDPLVTVTVTAVAPKEVYLIGEIAKTGPVVLAPGMTPLQVIAAAGGLSPFAKKKLYILRTTVKGQQKIPFDYKKALRTGDQQGVTLLAGDTIVVP